MTDSKHATMQLGDLVTAAFDAASQLGEDPEETTRLATRAVTHLLRRARISHTHRALH